MPAIQESVGRGGVNRSDDVKTVQTLLNRKIAKLVPLSPVTVSGECDAETVALIEEYQRRMLGLRNPDGRVDPTGRTIASLAGAKRTEPVLDGTELPGPAAEVLKAILTSAGLSRAKVTSVSRTPAEQARVMYENCVSKGAQFNKDMYAAAGDKVIDVYIANRDKPRAIVIQLMLDKINEVGPSKVSKHISDTHYTFDVAPSSIPVAKRAAFGDAVRAHTAVSKLIAPPIDPAFHIEILKDSPNLQIS